MGIALYDMSRSCVYELLADLLRTDFLGPLSLGQ